MTLHKSLVKDVSPKAIKQAVLRSIAQKPIIIYPTACAIVELLALLLTGFNKLSLIVFGAGLTLAAALWLWQYFVRGPKHALRFVKRCQNQIELKRRTTLEHLRKDMSADDDHEGLKQIDMFQHKYDAFVEALNSKASADALLSRRYLTIAEQVFLSGLDNLESAALAMRSVGAVDITHIETSLANLAHDDSVEAQHKIAEYRARLRLRDSQLQRAGTLLRENEQALTQLDYVSHKISETQAQISATALDPAMLTLQQLITRP